jgi:diguanylate cyclase (GGDEF)-like protein
MQALGESTIRTTAGRPSQWLAAARALPARFRASDFITIGASPRFRALQRRRMRAAARAGFIVIAAAAVFDGIVLVDRDPTAGPVLLGLNGFVAFLAVGGRWLLGRRLRRHPDAIATCVTLALTAGTAATGIVVPLLAVESAGYLLLFPVLMALILPWSTQTHIRWLVGYAVIAIGFLVLGTATTLSADDRGDLIVVVLVAMGASLAGHSLLLHASVRSHSQVRKIQDLRRLADADMQELARVHEALEQTARTDVLTGARNRLRLAEDLRAARARTNRLGHAHGLIAFDLDRFKLINDQFGHLAGDAVLKAVVAAARATIRGDDEIYRFGGEEFLVLMRVADADGLRVAAERLRAAVEGLDLNHPGNTPYGHVTISLGAVLVTRDDLGLTDDEWFAQADAALYRAKDGGRNRLEIAA